MNCFNCKGHLQEAGLLNLWHMVCVLVWVLQGANNKRGLSASEPIGKMYVKDKGCETTSRQGEPLDHDVGLFPVLEEWEGRIR